jgi:hypothetical protein
MDTTNKPYLVYLVSTDESATILNEPVFELDEIPSEITDEQVFDMVVGLLKTNNETLPENIKTGSEALEWMREEAIYYSEDLLVVVPNTGSVREKLFTVGDALFDTMGDDSSCYAAAESWSNVVRSHGEVEFAI